MNITAGTRLGPYEIVSRIGAGGMGEVWRAVDTRLDRSVAIKVLPDALSQNSQLKARFEREAKAISQLNHPNICTLHDVGIESGSSYLVMELLEGETLADRISRGPLPLPEVVRYGSQIAEALERAHRAGIVHRDLKPGNVMITKSGAKLLDFGLARSVAIAVSLEGATVQKPLTQEGTILGTFQYMAPEQLEGTEADARTDIFALGAVLYEMVTGRRAFDGKTKSSLIAAIVGSQPPPLNSIQPLTPSAIDHVISKCLEKGPEDRWQNAHDVAEELKWAGSGAGAVETVRQMRRLWPALVILALLTSGMTWLYFRERAKPSPRFAFSVLPPRGWSFYEQSISPDGQSIAYVARDQQSESSIWVRRINSIAGVRITERGAVTQALRIFWSPDGTSLGFFDAGGRLMKVSAAGGRPELICNQAGYGVGAAWNGSGTILFAPRFNEGLFRVPASGGDAVRVTSLDVRRRESLHGWPRFLPDGDHFLFVLRTISEAKNEIFVGSLSGPLKKIILRADALVGVSKGQVLFVREGAMYAQRFNPAKLVVEGDPRKIVDDVLYAEEWSDAQASVSATGAIVYPPSSNSMITVDVGWHDRSGKPTEKLFDAIGTRSFRLSPDDSRVVMTRVDARKGAPDLYVRDLARGIETRVSSGLSNNQSAALSNADDRVIFSSDRDGMYNVYAQSSDGTSPAEAVARSPEDKLVSDVSPDGKTLLCSRDMSGGNDDIWSFPTRPGGTAPRALVMTPGRDLNALFSPDGKWIVYTSDVSGRMEAYVRPYPDGRSVQVSTEGGSGAEWSADGTEILATSAERWLTSIPLRFSIGVVAPGKQVGLFRIPSTMAWWSASRRSSNRLLCAMTTDSTPSVVNYLSSFE